MKQNNGHILIRTILLLLLFCGVLGAGLIYYLSRFDLDDYRHTLEQRLSDALQQPVAIASSSMTFDRGLVLEFSEVAIGDDEGELSAFLPRLTARVQLTPLLHGELLITDVELHRPQIHLRLPLTSAPAVRSPQDSSALINQWAVGTLVVRQGEITITPQATAATAEPVHLTNLQTRIHNWQAGAATELILSGTTPQLGAEFLLETQIPPDFSLQDWRSAELRAKLHISGIALPVLRNADSPSQPVRGRMDITLEGQPNQGAKIGLRLRQAGTDEEILDAEGMWQSQPQRETLTTDAAQLLGLTARVHLEIDHDQRLIRGRIESEQQRLTRKKLQRFVAVPPAGPESVRLDRLDLEISRHWSGPVAAPDIRGHLALSDATWEDAAPWPVSSLTGDFELAADVLTITSSRLETALETVNISGTVATPFTTPLFDLTATALPDLKTLSDTLAWPADWQLRGKTHLLLQLHGTLDDPVLQLQVDATENLLELSSLYRKQAGWKAQFSARGRIREDRIQIESARLSLPPLEVAGAASITLDREHPRASITTEAVDLQTVSTFHPALARYHLQGTARLDLDWTPDNWQGLLAVKDGGSHLTSVIADLHSVTGSARLHADGLDFAELSAHLGTSSFTVSGSLRNWRAPLLRLRAKADRVRASDLVFFNPERSLHQVDGQLEIDRHGIRFDPVTLQVEEETEATVRGGVYSFRQPRVELEVTGQQVNVLDIISLFNRPSDYEPVRDMERPANQEPIIIHASAHDGTLGGLKFSNARATITEHLGVLSVSPLTFDSGDGWSRAKVEYLHRHPTAPLKISGHVNNIDASALHQDLLSKPGLIRGALTGDFYLEGDPADDSFWDEATGGVYVQVKEGTLRRFRGLARVFSLLNVSQIFYGKLPDMDREGMPFDLLEGSAQINAGLLYTEDLKISGEAMNMSLVGTRDLTTDSTQMILAVMPLRTVDRVVSSIPLAGWVLGGKDRALLTAYFRIEGSSEDPTVTSVPVGTLSGTVGGIFRRTLGLPEKLLRDFGSLFQSEPEKKEEAPQ